MTEEEVIALKFYIGSLKDSIAKLRELRSRANRNIRPELLGNEQAFMQEQMLRHMESELQGNVDIVFAIRMELLLQKHREELDSHDIEFVDLPLAFEQMELDEEGKEIARTYAEKPPEADLN